MEAKELMAKDWVYDGSINIQVTPENIFDIYVGNWDEPKPIPLTEEIFKANGFEKNPYYEEWVKPLNNQYKLRVSNKHISVVRGGTYPFNFVGNPTTYVHELQHALRLCELNELADNFVIS